jgi:S1-C subfamily serine protease
MDRMYLRILVVSIWILALALHAPAQSSRRKPRAPRPVAEPVVNDTSQQISLRQREPKGWVWVSQTTDLAKQYGGDENIMTLDGEPLPLMTKKRITLGLVIDDEGHIVTRLFDVSPNSPPLNVTAQAADSKPFQTKFIGMDTVTGLCVLKAERAGFTPAPASTLSSLPLRLSIRLYGFHPNLNQNSVSNIVFTRPRTRPVPGQIQKATGDFRYHENNPIYYLLSPAITPVQDGSLILEENDAVFGLAIYDIGSEGKHLVYPISRIKSIAQTVIKTNKSLAYGWLGINGQDTPSVINSPRPPEPGVIITVVAPDSPAELAGIKPKDVLLSVNDRRVGNRAQLGTALSQIPPHSEIKLGIKRGPEYRTVKAKLVPAPATEPEQELIAFTKNLEIVESDLRATPSNDPNRANLEARKKAWETFISGIYSEAPSDIRLKVFYGFEMQPLTSQLMNYFAVTSGVLVSSVVENNRAARAGLQAGDVIVQIGSKPVSTLTNLLAALDGAAGEAIEITVSRRRESLTIKLPR